MYKFLGSKYNFSGNEYKKVLIIQIEFIIMYFIKFFLPMEIFAIEVGLLKVLNFYDGKEIDIYPFLKDKLQRNHSNDKGLKIQSLLAVLERRGLIRVDIIESSLLLMYHDLGGSKELMPASIMARITDEGKTHLKEVLSNSFPDVSPNQQEVPQTLLRKFQALL